jgi:hypothetical protein
MIAGFTPFTLIHVLISLAGIVSGVAVLYGLLTSQRMNGLTTLFLVTTAATSITGFFFPFHGITPAIILGVLSLIVLAVAIYGRYQQNLRGSGRVLYVVGAVVALYFNCFVLVVQLFQKVPPLHALAPKGSEPPFAIVQGLVLLFFVVTGYRAARRFHPRPV